MSEQLIKDSNLIQLKKLNWKQSISIFSFLLSNYLLSLKLSLSLSPFFFLCLCVPFFFFDGQNRVYIGLGA
jgi:hypothetical protein